MLAGSWCDRMKAPHTAPVVLSGIVLCFDIYFSIFKHEHVARYTGIALILLFLILAAFELAQFIILMLTADEDEGQSQQNQD